MGDKKRGQGSIEFVILFIAMLFFLTFITLIIGEKVIEEKFEEEKFEVRRLGLIIQDEISIAKEASEGYSRNFEVPSTINGKPYMILIDGNRLIIQTDKVKSSYEIINITGSISPGNNHIYNENGTVYLNQ